MQEDIEMIQGTRGLVGRIVVEADISEKGLILLLDSGACCRLKAVHGYEENEIYLEFDAEPPTIHEQYGLGMLSVDDFREKVKEEELLEEEERILLAKLKEKYEE